MAGIIYITENGVHKIKESGDFIKKTRKKKKITQVELSKQSGITQGNLSRIEAGSKVTLVDFEKIVAVFDMQIELHKTKE